MLEAERAAIAQYSPHLETLTPGRTGNVSIRRENHIAITPSGIPYARLDTADIPVIQLDGTQVAGDHTPSTETPLHTGIYREIDTKSIVHTHSPWATTLAIIPKELPPVHYLLATVGGSVPVAPYATYGTSELAANVVSTLKEAETSACLLANHGLITHGSSLEEAIEAAQTVESIARVYCQALALAAPTMLSATEMETVAAKLDSYGPDN